MTSIAHPKNYGPKLFFFAFFLLLVLAASQNLSAQTFIPAHPVYARVMISNVSKTKTGDAKDYTILSAGDVSIGFYADAECTIPFRLLSATTVAVAETFEKDNDESATRKDYSNEYVIPAGVSAFSLGRMTLVNNHSYYDNFWHHYNNTWSYALTTGTTSKYTTMPTLTK